MFCYHVELLDCAWSDGHPPESVAAPGFEVSFQRRGARFRVAQLPSELTVRSAPETDIIFLSALREETVLARSDAIEIGGVSRRVGVRTVPLKAGGIVLCSLRFMWSVEAEDETVFSRSVENYTPGVLEQQTTKDGAAAAVVEKHDVSAHLEMKPVTETTLVGSSSMASVGKSAPFSVERVASSRNEPSVVGMPKVFPQEQPAMSFSGVLPTGEQEKKGPQLFVGSPQSASKDFLDYYVTSTQVVERPRAWRNLYTSPAPLLSASGLLSDETAANISPPFEKRAGPSMSFSLLGLSALENILLHPTNVPDTAEEDIRHALYTKKMNVRWRSVVSPSRATTKTGMHSYL